MFGNAACRSWLASACAQYTSKVIVGWRGCPAHLLLRDGDIIVVRNALVAALPLLPNMPFDVVSSGREDFKVSPPTHMITPKLSPRSGFLKHCSVFFGAIHSTPVLKQATPCISLPIDNLLAEVAQFRIGNRSVR